MAEPTTMPFWWGKYSIPMDRVAYWRIGPLEIWISRTEREWRIGTRGHGDVTDSALVVNRTEDIDLPSDQDVEWQRFGFRNAPEAIELIPALAPRPLVVRPETAFTLPPKEEATLYMSSPLWIQFKFGRSASQAFEKHIFRPSDTWFGPSTLVGELCYASRTRARLRLDELDVLPHRAHSALHIRNRATSELKIDRLKLAMPNLSVFAAAGRLWTEAVTLNRQADGDFAELQLAKEPPAEVHPVKLLNGPRSKPEKGLLIRAFGGLFG